MAYNGLITGKGWRRIRAVLVFSMVMTSASNAQDMKPEFVQINGHQQWIYYIGNDADKPVILFLHGGPGTAETPFLVKYNQNLKEDFIVACWEQRGAGRSYSRKIPDSTMTIEQFVADAHAVTLHLKQKFQRNRIYIMGHSWGTLIAMKTIIKNPQDYIAYFALSQLSHSQKEAKVIYDWLMLQAEKEPNHKATRQLRNIGCPSDKTIFTLKQTSTLIKWVNYYGGAAFYQDQKGFNKLVRTVITTSVYSFREKLRYLKSEKFSLRYLHNEIARVDLFEEIPAIKVPIVFIHGTGDYQIPLEVARSYYQYLRAPYKSFIEFDECAHGLLIEQPDKFKETVMKEIKKINTL